MAERRLLQHTRYTNGRFIRRNSSGTAVVIMATNKDVASKEVQIPEWEHIAAADGGKQDIAAPRRSKRAMATEKLDTVIPPHRTYMHLSRRNFLIALTAALLALIALIVGLAAGLSSSGQSSKSLPLPTNTEPHTGELTYFATGLGACGETNKNGDSIVSVSHLLFDAAGSSSSQGGNSNANPLCGQMLRATRYNEEAGGTRSVDLRVVDRCTGCSPTDLDVTEDTFAKLAPIASGRVEVTWAWLQ